MAELTVSTADSQKPGLQLPDGAFLTFSSIDPHKKIKREMTKDVTWLHPEIIPETVRVSHCAGKDVLRFKCA